MAMTRRIVSIREHAIGAERLVSVKMSALQRASRASTCDRSGESRVPVSRAPSHPIDDDRASRGSENTQADVNGTKE